MDIQITPGPLRGTVTPPPSKSMAHRLLLSAALGQGVSTVENVAFSKDIEATLRCMEALGVRWRRPSPAAVEVTPTPLFQKGDSLPLFDCGESGSTLRFMLPIALAVAGGGRFTGRGRLMERPQTPYFQLFEEKGIAYDLQDGVLTVEGRLMPGEYRLAGNVSSQFFTGLLFALPLLEGESTIISTTALESADYISMTIQAMERSGVRVTAGERYFTVTPQTYRPFRAAVEADWSQGAFWYAANALGSTVEVQGLLPSSAQGDRVVDHWYHAMAAEGDLTVDVSGCPDLLPPLAVMAAGRQGTTAFVNAARLRAKESDRLATVHALLAALGIRAEEGPDFLTVHGGRFSGGTVDGANDHRIVMAAAVAATAASGSVTIKGAEAVEKSYPDFFDHFAMLGGAAHVL